MWLASAFRIIGLLLMLFSFFMLPPVAIAWFYSDGLEVIFLTAFAIVFGFGFLIWVITRRYKGVLRAHAGFLVTVLIYVVLGLCGAVPFYLSAETLSFTDAVFESLSGLTTTGATALVGLDDMPRALLYYRQQLQWLGGMGIVVLAVAVLPMLGIGGMQLYRAEIPSPNKDSKLTPRITETARALWSIYLVLTIACTLGYAWAGMSWFDAVCHSFSTVSIGGFSTHDASFAAFNSPVIELIAIVFMLLCSINFSLHFIAWRRRTLSHYSKDTEFQFFIIMLVVSLLSVNLVVGVEASMDMSRIQTWRETLFQTVSIVTTTGFITAPFSTWPSFAPLLLFMLAFMGGCAGSASGGMKTIRVLIILRQAVREINRLIHPHAVYHIKLGERVVDERITQAVWGFFTAYVFFSLAMTLIIMGFGLDFTSAFSAVGATINNLGPGLGSVSENYSGIEAPVKWILCLSMLLGRLEIYTLLVLFAPSFWR